MEFTKAPNPARRVLMEGGCDWHPMEEERMSADGHSSPGAGNQCPSDVEMTLPVHHVHHFIQRRVAIANPRRVQIQNHIHGFDSPLAYDWLPETPHLFTFDWTWAPIKMGTIV